MKAKTKLETVEVIGAAPFNILSCVIHFGAHVRFPGPSSTEIDNFPMI